MLNADYTEYRMLNVDIKDLQSAISIHDDRQSAISIHDDRQSAISIHDNRQSSINNQQFRISVTFIRMLRRLAGVALGLVAALTAGALAQTPTSRSAVDLV